MYSLPRVVGAVLAAAAFSMALSGCGDDAATVGGGPGFTLLDSADEPLNVEYLTENLRTQGNNLVVAAGWFDCYMEMPTTCTGEQPVTPDKNDAFDEWYEEYAADCQEKISRTEFRLDMAERVRPWIVDDDADQILTDVDEDNRTATVEIRQTDGSTIVLHYDVSTGQDVPMCNDDGTLRVVRK